MGRTVREGKREGGRGCDLLLEGCRAKAEKREYKFKLIMQSSNTRIHKEFKELVAEAKEVRPADPAGERKASFGGNDSRRRKALERQDIRPCRRDLEFRTTPATREASS